nr:carbohydrate ABC transporter permease [Clostridia bacterium]
MHTQSILKKKNRLNDDGPAYKVFSAFNYALLTLLTLALAYPVYYVVAASFSNAQALSRNLGMLWAPLRPMSVTAYRLVFRHPLILSGYMNTIVILVAGLLLNMTFTCLGAYFLTLRDSMFRRPVALLILFTMYFNGGIVPAYLNVRELGMMDSLLALIVPGAISTYNMLIMRSAFAALPLSLSEAAELDGAGHFRQLTQVFIPLSGATLAVMVLYYGVGHWNAWFNASLYIQTPSKYPLQLVLRELLLMASKESQLVDMTDI